MTSSGTNNHDDDLEALSAKACALASVPVPDYAGTFKRENDLLKKKYGNRFTISEDDDCEDLYDINKEGWASGELKLKAMSGDEEADDLFDDGVVLAEKTASILNNFREYVSGIGDQERGVETDGLLSADSEAILNNIRGDGKTRIIQGASDDERYSRGSTGGSTSLTREWSYDGDAPNNISNGDAGHPRMRISRATEVPRDHQSCNLRNVPLEKWEGDPESDFAIPRIQRGQQYTHSILQDKRVKRGILSCFILVLVITGICLGVTSSKDDVNSDLLVEKIDDFENELAIEDAIKEIEDMQLGNNGAYDDAVDKFKPKTYNRHDGWSGEAYSDAVDFCADLPRYDNLLPYTLCQYEAICPLGWDTRPVVGYQRAGKWLPLTGNGNEWVQLSRENACTRYSYEVGEIPDWGMGGDKDRDPVSHLTCCVSYEGSEGWDNNSDNTAVRVHGEDPNFATYQEVATKFRPLEFDRSVDGWVGQTYVEALKWCGRFNGYEICNYDAICPMGLHSVPFGGYRGRVDGGQGGTANALEAAGTSWIPILDSANDWVQVGPSEPCVKYSATHDNPAPWSITGVGNEEVTRHITCCLFPDGDDKNDEDKVDKEWTPVQISDQTQEAYDLYEASNEKYSPMIGEWDDNGPYAKAHYFCSQMSSEDRDYGLCPFDAICPLGPDTEPLGGYRGGKLPMWIPISDMMNDWVQVSTIDPCIKFSEKHPALPDWGMTGRGGEQMTRYIACCVVQKEGNANVDDKEVVAIAEEETQEQAKVETEPPTAHPTAHPTPLPSNEPTPTPPPTPPRVEGSAVQTDISSLSLPGPQTKNRYNPVWYDRSSWKGQTYDAATIFCSKIGVNHDICPYEAICPDGPLSLPYGGIRVEPRGSWAPINEPFNSWVRVSDGKSCVRYGELNPTDHPDWGLIGQGNEDITRHVACCDMGMSDGTEADSGVIVEEHEETAPRDSDIHGSYGSVEEIYNPKMFNREQGWDGETYVDAIVFCASQDSSIPCPYEAYCPKGGGSIPTGEYGVAGEAWAPIMDMPNGWVQIGSNEKDSTSNLCRTYAAVHDTAPLWGVKGDSVADVTPQLMCCKEPSDGSAINHSESIPTSVAVAVTKTEQEVLQEKHPVWFGHEHGYRGTTFSEASLFCGAMGGMVVCPTTAYCPDGARGSLFLQKNPFQGENWAPASSQFGTGKEYWVSIGDDGDDVCSTHEELEIIRPDWASDGGEEKKKAQVLCCQSSQNNEKESHVKKGLDPIWMSAETGWHGGSHDDAIRFCESFGNRKLCPYTAYCPHGPANPPMGGHKTDFNTEGAQWAPLFGEDNHWVQIGQKYQNKFTTCLDSNQLEGGQPLDIHAEQKKHIMCCLF